MELAGSLGDLGTMLPLLIPMIVINGLNATMTMLLVGLFYVCAGLYYKIPVPVQPLKAVAIIAIAGRLPAQAIVAAGLIMGIILLFFAATGLINQVARVFSKPVVRGVQVALGLLLFISGVRYVIDSKLFLSGETASVGALPINLVVGAAGFLIVGLLLTNRKIPAAIVLLIFGAMVGLLFKSPSITLGPQVSSPQVPTMTDLQMALVLLVVPQVGLTIFNAAIATSDLAKKYYGKKGAKASPRALTGSMAAANLAAGALGGMPMCHGGGGLVAHHRFGARTGGSNLIIGGIFITMALLFGAGAVSVFGLIPLSILGVLLIVTGLELIILAVDVKDKRDFLVVSVIAGLAVATNNMTAAALTGIVLYYILKWHAPRRILWT
ncbi:MAG: putative sulfate/molybdate transporter [Hadesarchaea archaeon]|nr:putative sulfate/molybdate transporter [Hadesarchaea archaeon]